MKGLMKIALVGAVALTSISFVTAADARTRTISGNWSRNGHTGTYSRSITRQKGLRQHDATITNDQGQTLTRDKTTNIDAADKTATTTMTRNNADGTTATKDATTTWGNGQVDQNSTRTYKNGESSTKDETAVNNNDGTATVTKTYTGPNGKSTTKTKTVPWTGTGSDGTGQ